jgi:hypothetical protein
MRKKKEWNAGWKPIKGHIYPGDQTCPVKKEFSDLE